MITGYSGVPNTLPDETEHRRQLANKINELNKGKMNCTSSLTLTASSTTTTFIDSRLGATTHLSFMPTTAHAQAVQASIYVTNQIKGQCTVNHTSDANVDKTFTVAILG